jgi:hypothetical protein
MFRPSRGHLRADIWNKLGSMKFKVVFFFTVVSLILFIRRNQGMNEVWAEDGTDMLCRNVEVTDRLVVLTMET